MTARRLTAITEEEAMAGRSIVNMVGGSKFIHSPPGTIGWPILCSSCPYVMGTLPSGMKIRDFVNGPEGDLRGDVVFKCPSCGAYNVEGLI